MRWEVRGSPANVLLFYEAVDVMASDDIKIVCSRCGKHIGNKAGWGVEKISYSVCRDCVSNALKKPVSSRKSKGMLTRTKYGY
jgi:hypothetical protein